MNQRAYLVKKKKKKKAVCAFKSSCGGCSLGTRLKPSTCILADDQKEILSPYCCQFQFIRGKCHLLILTTMHNGRRSKLCERGQYSRAVGYVVMSAAKKKTESWTRGFCVTLGCSQVPLCSLPPPQNAKRLPRSHTKSWRETDREEISLKEKHIRLQHLDTQAYSPERHANANAADLAADWTVCFTRCTLNF